MVGRRGRHRAQRCIASAAWLAVLGVVTVARTVLGAEPAERARVELDWPAVESCPTAEQVRAEIDRLLVSSRGGPSGRVVSARAYVVPAREGEPNWLLRMETVVDSVAGERALVASSCGDLAAAAALIVALAVDPAAVEQAQASGPAAGPEPARSEADPRRGGPGALPAGGGSTGTPGGPAGTSSSALPDGRLGGPGPGRSIEPVAPALRATGASTAPTGHGALAPGSRARARSGETGTTVSAERTGEGERVGVRGFAGAQATVDLGSLPAPALGIGAVAGLHLWRVRVAVDGTYFIPQSADVEGRDAGGDFELFEVGLGACALLLDEPVELAPCVGGELGRMAASGYGVTTPTESEVLWGALRAGGLAAYQPIDWLALRLEAGIAVAVTRPRWLLVGVGEVDRPSAVAARFALGAEARF